MSLQDKFTLKELQTHQSRKVAEVLALEQQMSDLKRVLGNARVELNNINQKIDSFKNKQIDPVTEHAVLRYLQNVKNIDIDAVKSEIMDHAKLLYPISGDVNKTIDGKKIKIVIKDKTIITVVGLD